MSNFSKNISNSYSNAKPILVAVDCIIFAYDEDELKLLLFKRRVDPFLGAWSLIGSFVKVEEGIKTAAERILKENTGLENIFLEPLESFGQPNRDPGARVISLPHFALIRMPKEKLQLVAQHQAKWFSIKEVPSLIMDHNLMVEKAFEELRKKAKHQPLGFELLPPKFTIPQLLQLYQEIYQKEIDPANFRKKILSLKFLDKLEEKDKSGSRRGAFLYRFNPEKYKELLSKEIHFSLFG